MKAISLWQPYASLVPLGKIHETRSWSTSYRGNIAIHAAKRWTGEEVDLCMEEPFFSTLKEAGYGQYTPDGVFTRFKLPLGRIVAVAVLVGCIPTEQCGNDPFDDYYVPSPDYEFGNYAAGRFAWRFENIQRLEAPIHIKGHQVLFEVPDNLFSADVLERLAA